MTHSCGHEITLVLRRGHPAFGPACCRRIQPQQASGQTRHGQLSRESEIVSLSSYFFDSIFYEANESSSACRLDLKSKVETSTPPLSEEIQGTPIHGERQGGSREQRIQRVQVFGPGRQYYLTPLNPLLPATFKAFRFQTPTRALRGFRQADPGRSSSQTILESSRVFFA